MKHEGHLGFTETRGFEARNLPPAMQELFTQVSGTLNQMGAKKLTKKEALFILKHSAHLIMADMEAKKNAASPKAAPALPQKVAASPRPLGESPRDRLKASKSMGDIKKSSMRRGSTQLKEKNTRAAELSVWADKFHLMDGKVRAVEALVKGHDEAHAQTLAALQAELDATKARTGEALQRAAALRDEAAQLQDTLQALAGAGGPDLQAVVDTYERRFRRLESQRTTLFSKITSEKSVLVCANNAAALKLNEIEQKMDIARNDCISRTELSADVRACTVVVTAPDAKEEEASGPAVPAPPPPPSAPAPPPMPAAAAASPAAGTAESFLDSIKNKEHIKLKAVEQVADTSLEDNSVAGMIAKVILDRRAAANEDSDEEEEEWDG
eukprot:CAMPEP_0177678124 /NCGR_PEP_ID=MMETSP0447-20121125/28831_1 /TAXON_ID=0 /ORGANISM="Stygamoeba regulata, Strain BSH-02190019" /LENGTH=382 /DNA_ID=CAMNT_0019187085 /DNA_START=124 /DNA_END=1272 /DNA_ORIENTATION=-